MDQSRESGGPGPGKSFVEVLRGANHVAKGDKGVRGETEVGIITRVFTTQEPERAWLEGAFTGCLKDRFSWEEYGEEIRAECGGLLKVRSIGHNLVLLQGPEGSDTEQVLKGLDEWSEHWFRWWRRWESSDVVRERVVWTRWRGVPVHAWTPRFFEVGCVSFGSLVQLHEMTEKRWRLDEAFVKIATGLAPVKSRMIWDVDGSLYTVFIEEIPDPDRSLESLSLDAGGTDSGSDYVGSEEGGDGVSAETLIEPWSEVEEGGDGSVNGGGLVSVPNTRGIGGGRGISLEEWDYGGT